MESALAKNEKMGWSGDENEKAQILAYGERASNELADYISKQEYNKDEL